MKQYAAVKGEIAESCYVSPDFEDCVADVFSEFYTEHAKYAPTISSIKSYLWVLARFRAIAEYNFVFATIYGEHSENAKRRRKNFGQKKNGEAHRLVRRKFWNLVTSNKNIVKIYQNPLQFHCMEVVQWLFLTASYPTLCEIIFYTAPSYGEDKVNVLR